MQKANSTLRHDTGDQVKMELSNENKSPRVFFRGALNQREITFGENF